VLKTAARDCPDAALTQVRRAALDTLGVIAGRRRGAVRRSRARGSCAPRARPAVHGHRHVAARGAHVGSLANGTAGHAHDFDDTNFALMGHPSAPLLRRARSAEAETADGAPCRGSRTSSASR
jgi:2-methylcitrate dehydratase PrpD